MKTFNVQAAYNRNDFKRFLQDFLTEDFVPNEEELYFDFKNIAKGYNLGEANDLDLSVFEFIVNSSHDPRVTITKEVVALMKKYDSKSNALVAFYYPNSDQWRLSLITTDVEIKNGKISYLYSNPHRYSFLLGKDCKKHTPETMLFSKGPIKQRSENGKELDYTQDLISRFSLEVVNKEFYAQIYRLFEQLVSTDLKHPKASDNNQIKEHFAVRLIGRLIFCWFLKKKTRKDNSSLIPEGLLSLKALSGTQSYYHDKLEPLFFETLNKKKNVRIDKCATDLFKDIPFLNGGLFEPHDDDCYELGEFDQSKYFNTLTIPNKWFYDLFEVFETYNFTIDENTSIDMDLSVDPEILGRIFENLLASINPETQQSARNMTGSFYTPREIVDYMVTTSLRTYLKDKTDLNDQILDELFDVTKTPELTKQQKLDIFKSLTTLKALDPAVGSGAFPMGLLQKIMFILNEIDPDGEIYEEINLIPSTSLFQRNYGNKYKIIRDCIFGVDIQEMAIEIARLRFFLTLIVDEEADDPQPLPNLDFKFACANTLVPLPELDLFSTGDLLNMSIEKLKELRLRFFNSNAQDKDAIKKRFQEEQALILTNVWTQYERGNNKNLGSYADKLGFWNPFKTKSNPWFDPMWMFGVEEGFDIVIANPPYISTKGVSAEDKKIYESVFGFSDDTYNLFTFKGLSLVKQGGTLSYIIPKTFWTTQTKGNMRDLILSKTINYIFDTANPFETVMVDTCIIQVCNKSLPVGHKIAFLDGSHSLRNPIVYPSIEQRIYCNTQNNVIFKPTQLNMTIWEKYGNHVKKLYDTWWDKISTSKKIAQNASELEKYRKDLKPGDITLLGCITEGGQGLATANNGKYIAVRKSSKWAKNIYISRPKKLAEAIKKYPQIEKEIGNLTPDEFVTTKSEKEIALTFDSLKEKYGRDIFGQGYIYRLIDDSEMADVNSLSEDEKENGIVSTKNIYVPYDKGDKDGNRWYLETPFAIAWSRENVHFLKTDPKARYQGYSFFFKEGFCWNNILNPNARLLKCKLKLPTVNDVGSMSLMSIIDLVPNFYFVTLLNSNIIFDYYREFINCTVNIQINDIRQIPIIIPSKEDLSICRKYFDNIVEQKHRSNTNSNIAELERELDLFVCRLYSIYYSDDSI